MVAACALTDEYKSGLGRRSANRGHPWGNAAGAAANGVALEACVEDRNRNRAEGLEKRGGEVLRDAARSSPELDAAVGTFF